MRVFLIAGLLLAAGCGTGGVATSSALPADLDDAARLLAESHEHGETHNYTPLDERVQLLGDGGLVSFCAEVVAPSVEVLTDAGFRAHHIVYLALEPDENGIHQGHHVAEVWHPERKRWVIVDVDYGVMLDQDAASTRDGRVEPEPLEADARDTEWDGGYPQVAEGVGIYDGTATWFDPNAYTPAEQAVLIDHGWRPADDYAQRFYD